VTHAWQGGQHGTNRVKERVNSQGTRAQLPYSCSFMWMSGPCNPVMLLGWPTSRSTHAGPPTHPPTPAPPDLSRVQPDAAGVIHRLRRGAALVLWGDVVVARGQLVGVAVQLVVEALQLGVAVLGAPAPAHVDEDLWAVW
jgi:hypothetical protein